MNRWGTAIAQAVVLTLVSLLALQLFFVLRIACMLVVDPQSTSFQRSEAWRIARETGDLPWRQEWVPAEAISKHLKRAVIASEDSGFGEHSGVDWDAMENAWSRNQAAQASKAATIQKKGSAAGGATTDAASRVVGGSTITQQLAKNLLLSGERTVLRKAQELVLAMALEALLGKARILEIYLNSVEWGSGVFGAQAAAQHYYGLNAAQLSASQAARLAVMLPAPKRFEKRPGSPFLASRTATVLARMSGIELP